MDIFLVTIVASASWCFHELTCLQADLSASCPVTNLRSPVTLLQSNVVVCHRLTSSWAFFCEGCSSILSGSRHSPDGSDDVTKGVETGCTASFGTSINVDDGSI